jgi:RNase P subunit RPR2
MAFKTMPKEKILELLEQHEDTVSEPLQEIFSRIKSTPCPNCDVPLTPKADLKHLFIGDSHIPRYLGYCGECEYTMDPNTRTDEPRR